MRRLPRPDGVREDIHKRFCRIYARAIERAEQLSEPMWSVRPLRDNWDGSWDNAVRSVEEDTAS